MRSTSASGIFSNMNTIRPRRVHSSSRRRPNCRRTIVSAASIAATSLFAAAFLVFVRFPLLAVEVSLEENRAQRGNIGYVDLQLLFHKSPETQKAKQNFEEVVRQAEDQVNLRKSELLGLRAELAQLKAERDFVAKTPLSERPPQLPGMEIPQGSGSRPAPRPIEVTPSAAAAAGTPVAGSTAAASGIAVSSAAAATVAGSTQATVSPPSQNQAAAQPTTNLPGLAPEASGAGASPSAVSALDAKIADKTKLLQQKESEFKSYENQVEKNLVDLESRRTEILLGKIYNAVQQVAHDEGVSVVVDKSQILFGHQAVDLTPKVLDKLKTL